MEAETEVLQLQAKGHQGLPANYQKLGRSKSGFSPVGSRGNLALLTTWYWTSSLQNCEKASFYCFKSITLCYFVTAALWNWYSFPYVLVGPMICFWAMGKAKRWEVTSMTTLCYVRFCLASRLILDRHSLSYTGYEDKLPRVPKGVSPQGTARNWILLTNTWAGKQIFPESGLHMRPQHW